MPTQNEIWRAQIDRANAFRASRIAELEKTLATLDAERTRVTAVMDRWVKADVLRLCEEMNEDARRQAQDKESEVDAKNLERDIRESKEERLRAEGATDALSMGACSTVLFVVVYFLFWLISDNQGSIGVQSFLYGAGAFAAGVAIVAWQS